VVWESSESVLKGWHVQGGKYVATLEGHVGNTQCVAVSADGSHIVAGGANGLEIWQVGAKLGIGDHDVSQPG